MDNWYRNNIFDFRKADACAYLVLYVMLPVIITWLSVNHMSDKFEGAYCYLTVFVSASNTIYDAFNRWMEKGIRNLKLSIILLGCAVIAGYSLYVVCTILITKSFAKCDWFFLSYVLVLIVALPDVISCFIKDVACRECVTSGQKEGE